MKFFIKRISAFLTASVILISAAGISVFATPAPEPDDGWRKTRDGWQYYDSDKYEFVTGKYFPVEGILYSFDENGICTGKCSGLVKENGTKRRYNEGIPYTGWTKNKNDNSRKYYLDGYPVTGEFPLGGKVYSFDENGILTGSKKAKFTADCGGKISSDTDMFRIKICYNINDTSEFFAYDPKVMERWENGRWVNCRDTASEFFIDDCLATIKYSKSDDVHFRPQDYTGNKFTPGYYRLKMNVNDNIFYTVFEVVPPVEVRMSQEIYTTDEDGNIDVWAYVDINSEKLDRGDMISHILVWDYLNLNWESFNEEKHYSDSESCDSIDSNGTISLDLNGNFKVGCYETTITFTSQKYTYYCKMFRVDSV